MCDLGCDRHRHFGSVISVITSGGTAAAAADRKSLKYAQLAQTIFVPISMKTFGPLNMAGFQFLNKLGRRITQEFDELMILVTAHSFSSGCQ